MPNYLCATCGTQYAEAERPPESCPICDDERQYVRPTGQRWTTADELRKVHRNSLRYEEPGLFAVGIDPLFAIGQRALFLRTSAGNVLWDCVPLLDPALVETVRALGGLRAVAISHPHYYANMVDWSRAFGDVPVYLHADDRAWVMRPDPALVFWDGETRPLFGNLTLVRCGGHFDGGAVLHWPGGADGRGALLTGDILQVTADRQYVSFMYSYPNYLPLSAGVVRRIEAAVRPFAFDRIYGAFWDQRIDRDAKDVVRRSAERYVRRIQG